ncbi:DNA cytosine methyltransferase [Streptomyces luteireticuli]|uniref:DNA cytosine methyltransferase n=1 Tax=Streptomyces luteireticuli TaxID=173858 RepID=UPI0031E2F4A2
MAVQHVLGGRLAWAADPDPGPARILAHHHPDTPNLGDLTALDWADVEPVDVLTAGYPCQPFSTAGKRKGVDDPRHLWPHIAHALGVLRPRLGIFENVAAHTALGFGDVLSDLARLGRHAEWRCLRASSIGAPHQRNRLFLLTWLDESPADSGGAGLAGRGPGRTAPYRHRDRACARCSDPAGRSPTTVSDRCRPASAHSLNVRGHRPRAHGPGRRHEPPNRRRPLVAHPAGVAERGPADAAHAEPGSRDPRPEPGRGGLHRGRGCPVPQPAAGPGGNPSGPEGSDPGANAAVLGPPDVWGPYADAVARWAPVVGRPAPRPTDSVGRLNPALVEWMMGLPVGHVTAVPGLSRTAQLKALGNGVVPHQAAAAITELLDRKIRT